MTLTGTNPILDLFILTHQAGVIIGTLLATLFILSVIVECFGVALNLLIGAFTNE